MNEPVWITVARRYIGTTEIPGKSHSPTIQRWLRDLKAWWSDDETPWCGTFVAHCLTAAGLAKPEQWYRAKAYQFYGHALVGPAPGCLVVFERPGGGHVGFVVGRDAGGRLMVLGGNQGNKVSIAPFDTSRVIAYRWPGVFPVVPFPTLPLLASLTPSSNNEA